MDFEVKREVNKDLILNYLRDKGLSKSKFCKNCKISISTLNNIIENK